MTSSLPVNREQSRSLPTSRLLGTNLETSAGGSAELSADSSNKSPRTKETPNDNAMKARALSRCCNGYRTSTLVIFPTSLLNGNVWAASEQVRGKQPRTVPASASPDLISSEGTARSSFRVTLITWKCQLGRLVGWLNAKRSYHNPCSEVASICRSTLSSP